LSKSTGRGFSEGSGRGLSAVAGARPYRKIVDITEKLIYAYGWPGSYISSLGILRALVPYINASCSDYTINHQPGAEGTSLKAYMLPGIVNKRFGTDYLK